MNASIEQQIQNELIRGERLLWSGRPRGGLLPEPGVAPLLGLVVVTAFMVVWTGGILVAVVRGLTVSSGGIPHGNLLIATLMALVGASVLAYIFVVEPRRRDRTAYGVTDRRVLIIGGLIRRKVESLPLHAITDVAFREWPDGSARLSFRDFARPCGEDSVCMPEFAVIDDARHVYDLIQDAKAEQRELWP